MNARDAIDNFVLNCYWLADRFKCDPDIFLKKSFATIGHHVTWAERLDEGQRIEEAWQEKLQHG